MKVIHSKPKGKRILKVSRKYRPLWIEPCGYDWWFIYETGEWVNDLPNGRACSSSYYAMRIHGFNDVYSLKAAIRKIKKWDVPKGTVFNVYILDGGYSFKIIK